MVEYHDVPPFGRVRVSRRTGMRSMRISVHQNGDIRLSLPEKVSLQQGLTFLKSKAPWILKHKKDAALLSNGSVIAGTLTVRTVRSLRQVARSYVTKDQLVLYAPDIWNDEQIHNRIEQDSKKVLIKMANDELLPLAAQYAVDHGYKVRSYSTKVMRSKWGSCSSKNDLLFNAYLMQLPHRYREYVVYHELAHTIHHDHSKDFWARVAFHVPAYKEIRAALKKYPTAVFDSRNF